jgi:hypothetical protein
MSRFLNTIFNTDNIVDPIEKRRIQLECEFIKNGLQYNRNQFDCDINSYIHTNSPKLETIVIQEIDKERSKCDLLYKIHIILKEKSINIDKYNYTHIYSKYQKQKRFTKDNIHSIIKEIEMEYFFQSKPEYQQLCTDRGEDSAKSILVNKYLFNESDSDSSTFSSNNNNKFKKSTKKKININATTLISFD